MEPLTTETTLLTTYLIVYYIEQGKLLSAVMSQETYIAGIVFQSQETKVAVHQHL